jgi:glyoxylase-like metal-dependent hydrolase (beta-lactamase superfamily II)
VNQGRIRDAIDYRYDLSEEELGRIAATLRLNRAGFLALAAGRYPLPSISGLPFCLFPLRTPHGIGVANAYIVADCSLPSGLLFDAGSGPAALRRAWPPRIREVEAIFITHPETEHMGGLAEVRETRGRPPVFAPPGSRVPGATQVGDGAKLEIGGFTIAVLATPGHAEAHNSYLVRARTAPTGTPLLLSGDLLFAGSVGGAFFCRRRLRESVERLVRELPAETVVAPGHGPLTTLANEAASNPFLGART